MTRMEVSRGVASDVEWVNRGSDGSPGARGTSAADPVDGQIGLPLVERDGPPPGVELDALVEALLLVAPEPPTVGDLARGAGVTPGEIEQSLVELERGEGRGWVLIRHRETVQMASAPRFAPFVRRFLRLDRETRLSGAALEALAVIAYRQPATRAEVEAVRGVDCAGVLATLHTRGLVEPVGRLETIGHPIQYGTTPLFLRHFGLRSVAELPPLGEVEGRDAEVLLDAALLEAEGEEPARPTAEGDPAPLGEEAGTSVERTGDQGIRWSGDDRSSSESG